MKLISWNVNGFRACLQKGFPEFFQAMDADFFCLQETKMQPNQADFSPEGYHVFYHSAVKKGYSGTGIFTKHQPLQVYYGINGQHTEEGRVITLEYEQFYLVNCYVPNAQDKLARLDYRLAFEQDMRGYLADLSGKKIVIYCGDLNVAHQEIDLKNPKGNQGNPGFSPEERGAFSELLESGFVDTFRTLYPTLENAYSWWSYRFRAREKDIGWRIDYFVLSERAKDKIREAIIYKEVLGSDHCPVGLELEPLC